jgi:two-component sensor histidine kinase
MHTDERPDMLYDYGRFQQQLFITLIRWVNAGMVVGLLVNSYWFLVDFWSTLIQNSLILLFVLIGWWCIRRTDQVQIRKAMRVYLLSAMALVALMVLALSEHFILNAAGILYFFALLAMFLEHPSYSHRWAGLGIVLYVAALTTRILLPSGLSGYSTTEIVALYIFPILISVPLTLVGHSIANRMSQALVESEAARHQVERQNQELQKAQAALQVANEQLQAELAERMKVEERLVASEKKLRASLRQREMLLQEVHHRVKNNLQVISSLLDMQSMRTAEPRTRHVLRESQVRVRTMSIVHEKLYQSPDVDSVNARDYLRDVAEYLYGLYAGLNGTVALRVKVDDLSLDVDTAISCGLVISELLSNSLKYAFSDDGGGGGEVCVQFRSLDNGRLELTVSDNGIGLPSDLNLKNPDTLGLRLVNMLVQQLGGTVEIESKKGTAFRIAFAAVEQPAVREVDP